MTMKRIMMTTQNMQNKSSILPQPISTKQKVSTDYHVIILCLGQFFKLKHCIFVCISRFLFYLTFLQSTLNLIWGAHPTQIKAYAQYRTFFSAQNRIFLLSKIVPFLSLGPYVKQSWMLPKGHRPSRVAKSKSLGRHVMTIPSLRRTRGDHP